MNCLGIESTAHTFGIGIISDKGKIIYEDRKMFIPKKGSGFIPSELFNHHIKVAPKLLKNINMDEIDCIAFSQGPGIPNALNVGASIARYLSKKYKKKLIGINHCVAHIEIGKLLTDSKDPLIVYLSGGNTQIIAYNDGGYRVFGESLDIPVGNVLDVFARRLGLKMPGGPKIEKLGKEGKYIELPYVVKGMNLSFTGILTAASEKIKSNSKKDICYSLQETVFSMITEVTERGLSHTKKKEVLLVGGVASNKKLINMMNIMCSEYGVKCKVVPMKYAGDNGINIAWAGILSRNSKNKTNAIDQNWRVDQKK